MDNKKEFNEDKLFIDKIESKNILMKNFDFKKSNRRGSVWLYEKVGKTEIFIGSYPLLESVDSKLGKYYVCMINKKPIFVDNPRPEDFIPAQNKKIGKILELIKYGSDDYRIRERLNETFYKKVKRQVVKLEEIKRVNEETGEEEVIKVKKPQFDENEDPIVEEIEVAYTEPLAITQEARDAIRIGNEYERRMQEKRKNEGFWAKHGMQVMTYGLLALMVFGMIFTTKINSDALIQTSENLAGELKELRQVDDGLISKYAKSIVQEQDRIEKEKEAPPR